MTRNKMQIILIWNIEIKKVSLFSIFFYQGKPKSYITRSKKRVISDFLLRQLGLERNGDKEFDDRYFRYKKNSDRI